ncbi:reverse transcriptase-like protein [Candidatus Saccharibacteria bacterium]|nr:reverse transcriptase-like protein [Candidatus Saccharibacteria bacterium]
MKQRIRVVGIIRNSDGVLVLKRNRGRSEAPVFWELPTGKISFGEQPEEAMVRSLAENVGLSATSLKLKDVVTFMALEGSSQLSNLYIVYEVQVPDGAKPDPRDRYTAYKYLRDPIAAGVKLNEATMMVFEIENGHINISKVSPRDTANSATVYVDGASRGNPGPSGVGYVVVSETGEVLKQGGEFIGFATSRVAEYYALEEGMKVAIDMGLKSVRFVTDSLMVANQMNGIFQIKNQDILPIYEDVQKLLDDFEVVAFSHVPRSQNVTADREANSAIDQMLKN